MYAEFVLKESFLLTQNATSVSVAEHFDCVEKDENVLITLCRTLSRYRQVFSEHLCLFSAHVPLSLLYATHVPSK